MDITIPPAFKPLISELARWQALGKQVIFWLRDDDATGITPQFERLIKFQKQHHAPMAIAVIPEQINPSLSLDLIKSHNLTVMQHGWSHNNYAAEGEWHSEYPAGRALDAVQRDMNMGKALLEKLFGEKFVSGFVPPWNHFADDYLPLLSDYQFISGRSFTIARDCRVSPSIPADVDVLRWKPHPRFRGTRRLIREICEQLKTRRLHGRPDPVGILLHHRDMDDCSWNFMDQLAACIAAHPATRFLNIQNADYWQIAVQNIVERPQPNLVQQSRDYVMQFANACGRAVSPLLASLKLPKPAYAIISTVLIGIFLGHISAGLWSSLNQLAFIQLAQVDPGDMP